MIYSELKNYLSQITDPDVIDLFDRAAAILDQLEVDNWLDLLETAIGEHTDDADDGILDALRKQLDELLSMVVRAHGVVLTEEATTDDYLCIVEAIAAFPNPDVVDSVRLELQSTDSDQEIFASVVALCSSMSVERVLPLIAEIEEGLIGRLREIITTKDVLVMTEESDDVTKHLTAYAKFRVVFANDDRWPDRFVHNREAVGLPFDVYARLYMTQQLQSDLKYDQELAWRKICVNLIGLLCLSEEGEVAANFQVKDYLEKICPDMGELMRLFSKFSNLFLEFNRAQT
jgi:hypothetical protein